MNDRRTLTYVAFALIVGASLALAVALASNIGTGSRAQAAQSLVTGRPGQAALLGSDQGAAVAQADPAKTEPLLDQFVAKDPFIPLVTASGSATPTPSPTSTAAPSYSARVSVNGTKYTVQNGSKVPSGSPAFKVTGITASDVTFTVISGTLKNGNSSITVNLGESVRVTLSSGKTYDLAVLSISKSGGGGGGSGNGHSISVLSITSSNGTATVTLEVDGKTYADLKVGDTIDTPAGQISIVAINVSGQSVTIMLGDQTIVLHADQVYAK